MAEREVKLRVKIGSSFVKIVTDVDVTELRGEERQLVLDLVDRLDLYEQAAQGPLSEK